MKTELLVNFENYHLVGIGDFTHGINETWEYRLDVIKNIIKQGISIVIYNEDTQYSIDNIYGDKDLSINYKTHPTKKTDSFPHGPMNRYCHIVYDSPIYLKIIKFIRKHRDKIALVAVDSDVIARDKVMAEKILDHMKKTARDKVIRFFWAHNAHVAPRPITELYELKYAPRETHRCGWYLRKTLGSSYCVILSTGYKGTLRFSISCDNEQCTDKKYYKTPYFKLFCHSQYEELDSKNKWKLTENKSFPKKLVEYAGAEFPDGYFLRDHLDCDYILFFPRVSGLSLLTP